MKTLITLALLLLLATGAFAALNVHIAGHVGRRSLSPDGDLMLRIERHGARVNASCMATDAILATCYRARRGQVAIGDALCQRKTCTWTRLEISPVEIGGIWE